MAQALILLMDHGVHLPMVEFQPRLPQPTSTPKPFQHRGSKKCSALSTASGDPRAILDWTVHCCLQLQHPTALPDYRHRAGPTQAAFKFPPQLCARGRRRSGRGQRTISVRSETCRTFAPQSPRRARAPIHTGHRRRAGGRSAAPTASARGGRSSPAGPWAGTTGPSKTPSSPRAITFLQTGKHARRRLGRPDRSTRLQTRTSRRLGPSRGAWNRCGRSGRSRAETPVRRPGPRSRRRSGRTGARRRLRDGGHPSRSDRRSTLFTI